MSDAPAPVPSTPEPPPGAAASEAASSGAGPAAAAVPAAAADSGVPPNVAACLACIPLVGGIAFLVLEKNNKFVRFYAMQSVIFGGGALLLSIAVGIVIQIFVHIPLLGWLIVAVLGFLWSIMGLGIFLLWLMTSYKAFNGKEWEIPYLGKIAREQLAKQTPSVS
jgi:uncharacterized membrane protein